MIYSKIKKEIVRRNLSIKKFISESTGMSETGFHQAVRNHTLKIRDLEKISEALGVSMSYWWEEDNLANDHDAKYEKTGSAEHNAQLLRQKDEVIKARGVTIDALNDLIKRLEIELRKFEGDDSKQRA